MPRLTILEQIVKRRVVTRETPHHRLTGQHRSITVCRGSTRLWDSGRIHDLGSDGDGK